jgi:hypothetical protein
MITPKKSAACVLAVLALMLALSCSGKKQEELQSQASPNYGSASLEEAKADDHGTGPSRSVPVAVDWEEAFKSVRDDVRTEPSRFPLKTGEGVRWGRSGNSLEKALLLAQALQDSGLTVQVAEGELDDSAAAELVASIFPAGKEYSYAKDVPVSNPSEDPGLLAAVKRHFWVQREDGENWVDLDPSFPGAKPGQAFASVTSTFDPADEALKTAASIVLEYTAAESEEAQAVLTWEGRLDEVANQAVSLTLVAEFTQAAEEGEEEAEGAAGAFAALGGRSSKKKKAQPGERVSYTAALTVSGEGVAEGQFSPENGEIDKLSLKMRFESLDEVVSESERVLFEKTEKEPGARLSEARHPHRAEQDPG